MTPAERAAWSGPAADPLLRHVVQVIWRSEVLHPFAQRFGLTLVCGDLPAPPTLPPAPKASSIDAWQLYQAGELPQGLPLHWVDDVVIRQRAVAGLFYVWGSDRGVAINDAKA